jgi:hypothetical protein
MEKKRLRTNTKNIGSEHKKGTMGAPRTLRARIKKRTLRMSMEEEHKEQAPGTLGTLKVIME